MRKMVRISFACFLLMVMLFSMNLTAYAEAEEGESEVLDVDIGIIGDNPNVDIGILGDNPNVNIDIDGTGSDIYINDRNIEIPTVVNNSYHESYTTVVQGVSISDVSREINKDLTPLANRTVEVERGLTLAIDGLSKVILMIGNPNELPSDITSAINKIIADLGKAQLEVNDISLQLKDLATLVESDKSGSLDRDAALSAEIAKIQLELKKISDWSASIAKTMGDDRAASLERDDALSAEIAKIQLELKKISEWSAEIVKSIDAKYQEGIDRDNILLEKAEKNAADLKAEIDKRDKEILSLEHDRDIIFYVLAGLGSIMVIMMIMIIRLMRLRKKIAS
jgi:hypothetical protein